MSDSSQENGSLSPQERAKERAKAWRKEAYAKAKEKAKARREELKSSPQEAARKALLREKRRADYKKAKAENDAVKKREKAASKLQKEAETRTLKAAREAELMGLLVSGDKVGPPKLRVIRGGK